MAFVAERLGRLEVRDETLRTAIEYAVRDKSSPHIQQAPMPKKLGARLVMFLVSILVVAVAILMMV